MLFRSWINSDVMMATVVIQKTATNAKALFQRSTVHSLALVSLFMSFRREANSAEIASRAFSKAPFTVSASVISCGSKGEVTIYPPSSPS